MHSVEAGNEPAISVTALVKSFGDVRALDGVDLEAAPGTVLGILGPNGAGKTTTVRILSTLLSPDAGTARVAGLDVVRDAGALRAQIGLAGQYDAVGGVGEAEALEQLAPARLRGLATHAVEAADHDEVLEAGEVVVDRRVLAGEADAGAQRARVADDVEAGHAGCAGVGGEEGGEDPDRRGLAGPVGAEDAEDGAGSGLEVDAVEGADVAERLDQATDRDCRLIAGFN